MHDADVGNPRGNASPGIGRLGELLVVACLAALAGAGAYCGSRITQRGLLEGRAEDTWFDADSVQVYESMTVHDAVRHRASLHPLFPLLLYPPVRALSALPGVDPERAVRLVMALAAALWAVGLYALFRTLGCLPGDSALVALAALASASSVFGFVVPETYVFGSLTILAALLLAAVAGRRRVWDGWYVTVAVATLAITVTNGIFGLAAILLQPSWRRALRMIAAAAAAVLLLAAAQQAFFPKTRLLPAGERESRFLDTPRPARVLEVSRAMAVHTMVMPAIGHVEQPKRSGGARVCLSVQASTLGSAGIWCGIATAAWLAWLGLGLWALGRLKEHRGLRVLLVVSLCLQWLLHLFYGPETFLYALHFTPLLVTIASLALLTPARRPALVLAAILALTAGVNNVSQLRTASAFYGGPGSPAGILRLAPVR